MSVLEQLQDKLFSDTHSKNSLNKHFISMENNCVDSITFLLDKGNIFLIIKMDIFFIIINMI